LRHIDDYDGLTKYRSMILFTERLVTSIHVLPADQTRRPASNLQIACVQSKVGDGGFDKADNRGFDDLITDIVGISICQQKDFSRCHIKIFLRSARSVLCLCFVGQLLVVLVGATKFSVHFVSVTFSTGRQLPRHSVPQLTQCVWGCGAFGSQHPTNPREQGVIDGLEELWVFLNPVMHRLFDGGNDLFSSPLIGTERTMTVPYRFVEI